MESNFIDGAGGSQPPGVLLCPGGDAGGGGLLVVAPWWRVARGLPLAAYSCPPQPGAHHTPAPPRSPNHTAAPNDTASNHSAPPNVTKPPASAVTNHLGHTIFQSQPQITQAIINMPPLIPVGCFADATTYKRLNLSFARTPKRVLPIVS